MGKRLELISFYEKIFGTTSINTKKNLWCKNFPKYSQDLKQKINFKKYTSSINFFSFYFFFYDIFTIS